jgi:hypothetical protein
MKRWYWFGALARWCIADAFMPPVFMVLSAGAMIREANREGTGFAGGTTTKGREEEIAFRCAALHSQSSVLTKSTAGGMEGYSYKKHATPPYMVRNFR